MSNLTIHKDFPPDMHPKEVEGVKKFIEDGMPGLGDLKPEQIEAAVSMYMDGCTYQKISSTLSVKKQIVAFLAYKHDFYTAKMDMLASLVQSSKTKMEINHLKSVDFLTDMMSSIEARYRDIILKYKMTKDPRVLDSMDTKNLELYMKFLTYIEKIKNSDSDKKSPLMGLNLPEGGTLRKIDDNTIEVSASSSQADATNKKFGEVLSALAEIRKQREQK